MIKSKTKNNKNFDLNSLTQRIINTTQRAINKIVVTIATRKVARVWILFDTLLMPNNIMPRGANNGNAKAPKKIKKVQISGFCVNTTQKKRQQKKRQKIKIFIQN